MLYETRSDMLDSLSIVNYYTEAQKPYPFLDSIAVENLSKSLRNIKNDKKKRNRFGS